MGNNAYISFYLLHTNAHISRISRQSIYFTLDKDDFSIESFEALGMEKQIYNKKKDPH